MALTFDDLLATTLAHHRKELADNIFSEMALLDALRAHGQVSVGGGTKAVFPLMYSAGTSNGGSFSGLDAAVLAEPTGISAAAFDWKYYQWPIVHAWTTSQENRGKEAVIRLITARIKQAKLAIRDDINTDLYGDGTGNGGKDITGLTAMAPIDPSDDEYGGIASADYAWWRSQTTDVSAGATKSVYELDASSGEAFLLQCMRGQFNFIVARRKTAAQSVIWLADTEGYDMYESLIDPRHRVQDDKTANLGWTNITFKGRPVIQDANVVIQAGATEGTSTMYCLPMSCIEFMVQRGAAFQLTKPTSLQAIGKQGTARFVLFGGNLGTDERRLPGVLYNLQRTVPE